MRNFAETETQLRSNQDSTETSKLDNLLVIQLYKRDHWFHLESGGALLFNRNLTAFNHNRGA